MIKIIHAADIHLDSPFRMEDLQKAQARKNELRAAFSSLIYWVKTEAADLLLIAGDLFDSPHPSGDAVDFVLTQFRLIPNCRVFIAPGEHDFYAGDSVYVKTKFPDNVTVFRDSSLTKTSVTTVSGDRVNVYGYAFTSPIMEKNPFSSLTLDKSDEINLICGHGTLTAAESKLCPITLAEVRTTRADYIALGHVHNTPGIKKIETTFFGYSGSLEPRSFNDCGERGAYKIEITKKGGTALCRPAFFRLAKRMYATDTLDLTGQTTLEGIAQAMAELIKEKEYASDTLLRLEVTGKIPPELDSSPKTLASLVSGVFYCEVIDNTTPLFDLDSLKKDPTVKGEIVRSLLPLLESAEEEEAHRARTALRYALLALSGKDITDV